MRSIHGAALPLLLLLCGAAAVSCGKNEHLLNTKKGERVLTEWLDRQGLAPESIHCPGDIKMQAGLSFLCKATIANSGGVQIDLRVKQTTSAGDIRIEHASTILITERVERGVSGQIKDQTGKPAKVDCGARVRLLAPGDSFRCTVDDRALGANGAAQGAQGYEMQITMIAQEPYWQAQRL